MSKKLACLLLTFSLMFRYLWGWDITAEIVITEPTVISVTLKTSALQQIILVYKSADGLAECCFRWESVALDSALCQKTVFTYSQVLPNGFHLITNIVIILSFQPTIFHFLD